MIAAVTTGATIALVSDSSDGDPDQQRGDADQQPRHHPEVAQPRRRGEDAAELARRQLDELGGGLAVGLGGRSFADHSAASA